MLIKNTSASSKTWVELDNTTGSVTVLAWQIVSVSDDKGRAIINQDSDFEEIFYSSETREVEVTLTTTQILALNTTPIQLITAPWAGYAIAVDKVYSSLDYNSAAYATNTDLEIRYDWSAVADGTGSEVTMDTLDAILLLTADAVYVTPWLWASADTAITINKWVTAIMNTWDPITWNSPLTLKVIYRIIKI